MEYNQILSEGRKKNIKEAADYFQQAMSVKCVKNGDTWEIKTESFSEEEMPLLEFKSHFSSWFANLQPSEYGHVLEEIVSIVLNAKDIAISAQHSDGVSVGKNIVEKTFALTKEEVRFLPYLGESSVGKVGFASPDADKNDRIAVYVGIDFDCSFENPMFSPLWILKSDLKFFSLNKSEVLARAVYWYCLFKAHNAKPLIHDTQK